MFKRCIRKLKDRRILLDYPDLKEAFQVGSHLTSEERVKLYVLSLGASHVAEIGSYVGASACCFAAAVRKSEGGKVICIDTWNNDAMTEGKRDTWQQWQDNTRAFQDCLVAVRGYSTDVVSAVADVSQKLDVLFIDGDHSVEGVKADWEAYRVFLTPGSLVIFHDYGWADGVQHVVNNDVRPLVGSCGNLPNMWWGRLRDD